MLRLHNQMRHCWGVGTWEGRDPQILAREGRGVAEGRAGS